MRDILNTYLLGVFSFFLNGNHSTTEKMAEQVPLFFQLQHPRTVCDADVSTRNGKLVFSFINFGIIQYNFKENDCVSHAILINYKYYVDTICYGSILEQFIMSTIVTLGDVMFFVVILIVLSPRHQRSNVNL